MTFYSPPLFPFNSQTSDNFEKKKWIFRKFRQNWRNVKKFLVILALKIFWCISLKDLFCTLCHWKTPFFDAICHQKTLHLRCLMALVRHFHMWVPPGVMMLRGRDYQQIAQWRRTGMWTVFDAKLFLDNITLRKNNFVLEIKIKIKKNALDTFQYVVSIGKISHLNFDSKYRAL